MATQKHERKGRQFDDGECMHRQGRKPKGKKPNHNERQDKYNWDKQ